MSKNSVNIGHWKYGSFNPNINCVNTSLANILSMAVAVGNKYIITAWIREKEWDPLKDDLAAEKYLNETKDLPLQYGKAFDLIDTPEEVTNLVTAFLMKHKDNIKKIINFMNKAKDHVSIYQKNLS